MILDSIDQKRRNRQEIIDKLEEVHSNAMTVLKSFNLFVDKIPTGAGSVLICDSDLDRVPPNYPFDSDGNGIIINTKVESEIPGHHFLSVMTPNGFIGNHHHEGDKLLKVLNGSFYNQHTNKWYGKGEYLLLKTGDTHNILSGNKETELLTFIMPKQ
tara:strand:- start:6330 stop:6800 length:471 start_codon:yes stop_codon:yes gene_type:complete